MKNLRLVVLALVLASAVGTPVVARADIYMQNPRGSNNRTESSASSDALWDLISWFLG